MNEKLEITDKLLRELIDKKFYGSVTFMFESGKIVRCKKEETIKFHNSVRELVAK